MVSFISFKKYLEASLNSQGGFWKHGANRVWSFGPSGCAVVVCGRESCYVRNCYAN